MKAIVCEMCNSHDVVKQDGFFVCQSCGTKYSTEDAKKLMIEVSGSVDVTGSTVKVDNSDSLQNARTLARRAKASGDAENAVKYYDLIALQDPKDWEACFYSVYFRSASCKIAQIDSAAISVSNCIPNAMNLIKQNVSADKWKACYTEILNHVNSLCKAFDSTATSHYLKYSSVDGASAEKNSRIRNAYNMKAVFADTVWKLFGDKEAAVSTYESCSGNLSASFVNDRIAAIDPERGVKAWKSHNKSVIAGAVALYIFAALLFVWRYFAKGPVIRPVLLWTGIFAAAIAVIVTITAIGNKVKINNLSKQIK